MTIRNKIIAYLTTKEADHEITYIMLSYVYKFSNIRIKDGVEKYRLCEIIRKQSKMKRHLQEEEYLRLLADTTLNKYF